MIKKIFFQFWHDRQNIPDVIQDNFEANQRIHNDYVFVVVDDYWMRRFILRNYDSKLLNLYINNRVPASRCDIARLLLIIKYGGIYLDASWRCTTHLGQYLSSRLPNSDLILLKRHDINNHEISNGLIASQQAQNPMLLQVMKSAVANLEYLTYNKNVWAATGPGVYREVIPKRIDSRNVGYLSLDQELRDSVLGLRFAVENKNRWQQQQKSGIYTE